MTYFWLPLIPVIYSYTPMFPFTARNLHSFVQSSGWRIVWWTMNSCLDPRVGSKITINKYSILSFLIYVHLYSLSHNTPNQNLLLNSQNFPHYLKEILLLKHNSDLWLWVTLPYSDISCLLCLTAQLFIRELQHITIVLHK